MTSATDTMEEGGPLGQQIEITSNLAQTKGFKAYSFNWVDWLIGLGEPSLVVAKSRDINPRVRT